MADTHKGPAATVLPPSTFKARRKAALDKVVARANMSEWKPASLGAFSVAPDRNLWSSLHNPQIRAAGGRGLGEAEFRCFVGLGNVGPVRQARIVDHVLRDADDFAFAAKSGLLAAPLQTARELARRVPANGSSHPDTMRVTAIGLCPAIYTDEVDLTFDVGMLGDDLRPGIERVSGWSGKMSDLETEIERKVARHAELSRRKKELAAAGALCWIDEIAFRITKEAGLTIVDVMDLLTDRTELQLVYNRPGSQSLGCSIRWERGSLRGCVGGPSDKWQWASELLSVKGLDLPNTITCAMPGRRLGALVDHPLIPAEAIITGWHDLGGLTSIPLLVGKALVLAGGVARRADGAVDWTFQKQPLESLSA